VKILFDPLGAHLAKPRILNLSAAEKRRIVSEVDPFIKGVEALDYL